MRASTRGRCGSSSVSSAASRGPRGCASRSTSVLPGLRAVNFYGLSEMCGPGVATECIEARDGLHVHEDHFLVEVVDPDTGAPLADGAEGELVFTTLAKEAMPLLRYRTGDLGSVTRERCVCGRTTARIRGLRGRRDDMIIVRGVNVYPSNVEHALARRRRRSAALPARRRPVRDRWRS